MRPPWEDYRQPGARPGQEAEDDYQGVGEPLNVHVSADPPGLAVDITDDRSPDETDEQYRARMFAEGMGPSFSEEESAEIPPLEIDIVGGQPWQEFADAPAPEDPGQDWLDRLPDIGPLTHGAKEFVRTGIGAAQGLAHVGDRAANLMEGAYNNTFGQLFGESESADNPAFQNVTDDLGRGNQLGRAAGEIGGTALLTRGMGGPIGQGMASGALFSDADNALDFGRDVIIGGAGGYLGDKAIRGVSGVIAPKVADTARSLYNRGIRMTPGQVIPGLRRTEDRLTSRPFVGDQIVRGRQQSYDDFNIAGLQEVVAPYNAIRPAVPVTVPRAPGQGAVRAVGDQLSSRYERLIPNLRLVPDEQLGADIAALQSVIRSGEMSPAALKQFETIVRNHVMSRLPGFGKRAAKSTSRALVVPGTSLGPTGGIPRGAPSGPAEISGQTYRQIERNISRQISRFSRSQEPDNLAMAEAFRELQDAFQGALQRSNPRHATELAALNTSWRNLVRVEGAATNSRGGLFSPQAFRQAVKMGDSSTRRRAMARGEAPMQEFAEAAVDILPPEYPDSGTAGRSQMSPTDPRWWMGAAQGLAYGPKTQQAITQAVMFPRPSFAAPVAEGLQGLPAPQLGAYGLLGLTGPFRGQ